MCYRPMILNRTPIICPAINPWVRDNAIETMSIIK